MKNYFQGKVAIITGSSSGIGKSTATELMRKGASIMLNGRNQERLNKTQNELKALGGKVSSFCCDISDAIQARQLIEKTIEVFGSLDILINNAGVSMRGDFSELDPGVFNSVFETNVFGIVNTSIPALPHIRQSGGSIVFVSSLAGIRGLPGLSAYCSSKMALRAIAESIRIEEARSKIHVGLIFVGYTEIEHDKKTIAANGSLVSIKDRSGFKAQSSEHVANAILRNIRKRTFRTTLTGLGKVNSIMQRLWPGLVEKVLIRSVDKIKERS